MKDDMPVHMVNGYVELKSAEQVILILLLCHIKDSCFQFCKVRNVSMKIIEQVSMKGSMSTDLKEVIRSRMDKM